MRAPFLFLALLSATAAAQPADTVSVEATLPEVTVVATRLATLAEEAPSRVTLLSREAIDATGSRSVADLLEARSTLFVRRYGPAGLASVSFRGSGASQTLMLLDGHRIADPQLGQLDLSLLPAILLDRVEIMHGAGSALHGTDGIGGVVDLRTIRPLGRELEVTTVLGAFGERSLSGRAALGSGTVRAVLAAETSASDGDFPYFDPRLGASGETARRLGADSGHASLFARVETDLSRSSGFAAVWITAADRGVPGTIGAPVEARQVDQHLRAWGGSTTSFSWGTLRLGGLLQRGMLRYNSDEGRATLASAEVEARVPTGNWLLAAGMSTGIGEADHPRLSNDAREARLGAFASGAGTFGNLTLYPALRVDAYLRTDEGADNLHAVSPRMGLNWRPLDSQRLHLKASAGTAYRAPTFNDRFWQYAEAGAPGGQPDLNPERGWSADLGVHFQHGRLRTEATAYGSWLRDQIVWHPAGGGYYAPLNLGRTRTLGLEASADVLPISLGSWTLGGGLIYSLTDARDRSDPSASSFDRPLRYVPRHQVKANIGARRAVGERFTIRLDADARFVAARPVRSDGTLSEPAYHVTDVRLRGFYRFDGFTMSLSSEVENVFDVDYAVLRGYPMPPRHGRVRLHLSF